MGPVPRFDHEMLLGIIDCPCNGEDPGCEHEGERVEDLTWALTLCRNVAAAGALCATYEAGADRGWYLGRRSTDADYPRIRKWRPNVHGWALGEDCP